MLFAPLPAPAKESFSSDWRYDDYPTANPNVILHFSPVTSWAEYQLDTPLARQVLTATAALVAAKQPATEVVSHDGENFIPTGNSGVEKPPLVWGIFVANVCDNQAFTWQVAAQAAAAYKKWADEQTAEGVYAPPITLRNPNVPPRQPGYVVGFMGLVQRPRPGLVQGVTGDTPTGPAHHAIEALKGDCAVGSEATQ